VLIESVGTGVAGDADAAADESVPGAAAAVDVGYVVVTAPGPVDDTVGEGEGVGDAEVGGVVGALVGVGDGDGDGCGGPAARSTCSKRIFAAEPK
jgi:hypothetical protein